MPRLKDYPWWPTVWVSPAGWSVTHDEMIRVGIFQNARRLRNGLSLEVKREGVICTATIKRSVDLSEDDLILLRHVLLQHYGEEMRIIADLNIDFSNTGD